MNENSDFNSARARQPRHHVRRPSACLVYRRARNVIIKAKESDDRARTRTRQECLSRGKMLASKQEICSRARTAQNRIYSTYMEVICTELAANYANATAHKKCTSLIAMIVCAHTTHTYTHTHITYTVTMLYDAGRCAA